jgi:hypothetical protein
VAGAPPRSWAAGGRWEGLKGWLAGKEEGRSHQKKRPREGGGKTSGRRRRGGTAERRP